MHRIEGPDNHDKKGKKILCRSEKKKYVTRCFKEPNKSRLTLIAVRSSKEWEMNHGVKVMTDSVWSELIHNLSVSVVFFQITVISRETLFSLCEWMFSLHSLCMNSSNWMTCSLNAVWRQVGSFNAPSHNTCFVFVQKNSGSILDFGHLLSCPTHQLTDIQCSPLLTNQSFLYLSLVRALKPFNIFGNSALEKP